MVNERDLSRNPLFQVMFVLRNTPEVPELLLGDVKLVSEGYDHTTSMFDLQLFITETAKGLQFLIEYNTDLFNADTIERLFEHYKNLLNYVVNQPEQHIGLLPMLSETEKHQLLDVFNNTEITYPECCNVIDLFEKQVLKTPEATAVVFEQKQFSYHELNERANKLAHYLHSKGVKQETLVPICIERSLEMIVGKIGRSICTGRS